MEELSIMQNYGYTYKFHIYFPENFLEGHQASSSALRACMCGGGVPAGDATARYASAASPARADLSLSGQDGCKFCCPCTTLHCTDARFACDALLATRRGACACVGWERSDCENIMNDLEPLHQ